MIDLTVILNKKVCTIVFFALIMGILAVAGISIIQLRASNSLLHAITLLRPGTKLSPNANNFGTKLYEFDDVDYMIFRGSIKDRSFCAHKKLFWFSVSAPPARVLEVYTDTNNVVVFVTWQYL